VGETAERFEPPLSWAPPEPGSVVVLADSPRNLFLARAVTANDPARDVEAVDGVPAADDEERRFRPWMAVVLVAVVIGGSITAWRLLRDEETSTEVSAAATAVAATSISPATVVTAPPASAAPDTSTETSITSVLDTTVALTIVPETTTPPPTVPPTIVPTTAVAPGDDPAATPPVPSPEVYTGPGSAQVMNAPMPSGPPYEEVRSSLIVAQRLADAFASEDWVNARSLLARPPADDGGFALAYGLTDRYSLLLLDARVDGPGYELLLGTVRNEVNQTQTSVGCVQWYVEPNRPIVDIVSERAVATFAGSAFSPEGLRNNPDLDAQLRSSCGWLPS
jgi:hypothetical protein